VLARPVLLFGVLALVDDQMMDATNDRQIPCN
jgi:hypothetical protein